MDVDALLGAEHLQELVATPRRRCLLGSHRAGTHHRGDVRVVLRQAHQASLPQQIRPAVPHVREATRPPEQSVTDERCAHPALAQVGLPAAAWTRALARLHAGKPKQRRRIAPGRARRNFRSPPVRRRSPSAPPPPRRRPAHAVGEGRKAQVSADDVGIFVRPAHEAHVRHAEGFDLVAGSDAHGSATPVANQGGSAVARSSGRRRTSAPASCSSSRLREDAAPAASRSIVDRCASHPASAHEAPASKGEVQTPEWQAGAAAQQAWPQPPQFFASVAVSTQLPPQHALVSPEHVLPLQMNR